jgi:uncharacterized protein (TIGR03000 family)
MARFQLSFAVPAVLAAGFLFLMAPTTQAQPATAGVPGRYVADRPVYESFSAVVGHSSPIFLTSINYPGLYGAYTYGVPAHAYNTRPSAPTFHGILDTVSVSPAAPAILPPAEPVRENAYVNVLVPSEASLWIQDVRMDRTGSVREFVSPPLAPGQDYTYTVRASWTENGRDVIRQRVVHVAPGDRIDVDLLTPPAREESTTTLRARPLP